MELYTTSSYNETMSGGGETLSSISEKSCISQPDNHSPRGQQPIYNSGTNTQNNGLPLQLMHNSQGDFISPMGYVVSLHSSTIELFYVDMILTVSVITCSHYIEICILGGR